MAKKGGPQFRCTSCGHVAAKWSGRCPSCGEWNSLHEEARSEGGPTAGSGRGAGAGGAGSRAARPPAVAATLAELPTEEGSRMSTGIGELDRVLGGGMPLGAAVMIGGEPGIGKSTLMLQAAAGSRRRVLYITGEESPSQVALRARRLGVQKAAVTLLAETDTGRIASALDKIQPEMFVIDSVQTLFSAEAGDVPGTVNQIKYGCYELIDWARAHNVPVFFVAHVTKDGSIAGPKAVEHMVDAVLFFEQSENDLRFVRATKNRFGAVEEVGLFAMQAEGLVEITDPTAVFLVRRSGRMPAGIAAAPVYEGSRILMLELQALTVPAKGGISRVFADRVDSRRVARIAAVLEKHIGPGFSSLDIYVNVAGGMRVADVGVELPLALALYSAFSGQPVPSDLASAGELSLTGELRPAAQFDRRRKAAAALGYSRFIGPKQVRQGEPSPEHWEKTESISEAIRKVFGSE
ncbi:MAG: DNA repair protein RadA [Spirochaetia bacterium]